MIDDRWVAKAAREGVQEERKGREKREQRREEERGKRDKNILFGRVRSVVAHFEANDREGTLSHSTKERKMVRNGLEQFEQVIEEVAHPDK
jgi:hypothetical protein